MKDERGEGRGPKGRAATKAGTEASSDAGTEANSEAAAASEAGVDGSVDASIAVSIGESGGANVDGNIDSNADGGLNGVLEQIEYLLYQSTQGIHFLFDREQITRVLSRPAKSEFYTERNRKKIQKLLTGLLDATTFEAKRSFLESRTEADFDLLVRAYFQLVEKTILAHSNIRH